MHPHSRKNTTFSGRYGGYEALLSAPHRFTFNGQERDDEVSGEGNSLSFKYRVEDSRIGRFFSVDPLVMDYPMYSSYGFAANQPIHAGDLEGLENPADKNPTCFVVPMSPEDVDPNIWTPVPYGTSHDQGHTLRWYDKDGNMLAYDGPMSDRKVPEKPSTKEGWHMYNSNQKRYGADGGLAGFDDSNGNRIYNKNQKGGPGDGHLTSGQNTQIKVGGATGIMQKLNSFAFFLNFGSMFMDSPNSLLYTYHQIGTGAENRAYPVTGTVTGSLYYEWKWTDASKTLRQITTFYNYEYKNDQWRGTDPTGNIQYFDNDGNEVKLY